MLWTLGTTACLPIPSCPCCFFSCSVEFIYHQARALSNNYYWDIFLKPSAGCYHPPPPSAPKCQHATAVLWQWIASSSCIHHQHWLLPVPKNCIWLTNHWQLLHQMKRWPVMLPAALSLPAKRLCKAGETFCIPQIIIPAAPAWAWAPCSCSQSRKVGYTSLCQWPDKRTSVKGAMVTFEYWLVLLLNTCQSLLACILVCSGLYSSWWAKGCIELNDWIHISFNGSMHWIIYSIHTMDVLGLDCVCIRHVLHWYLVHIILMHTFSQILGYSLSCPQTPVLR